MSTRNYHFKHKSHHLRAQEAPASPKKAANKAAAVVPAAKKAPAAKKSKGSGKSMITSGAQ